MKIIKFVFNLKSLITFKGIFMKNKTNLLRSIITIVTFVIVTAFLFSACSGGAADDTTPAGKDGWLKGNTHEKFETVAEQLQGFGFTMSQVHYRFKELYWAGKDENWDYAKYQLEELTEVLEFGFVRRPSYFKSAENFMNISLPLVEDAIKRNDTELFGKNIELLISACNTCHVQEDHGYINIVAPDQRFTAVKKKD